MATAPTQSADSLEKLSGVEKKINPVDLRDMYTLHYRKGQNPFPMSKNFVYTKTRDMAKIVEFCRDHCERIQGRFIRVVPFLADLAQDEQKHQDNEG